MKSIKGLNSIRNKFSQIELEPSVLWFISLILVATIIIIIIASNIKDSITADQIGFFQLVIACIEIAVTIIAVGLAFHEFGLAQRKPDLNIYFQENGGALVKTLGIHRPESSRYFNISLVLKNRSKAAAEFVKLEVDFQQIQRLESGKTQEIRVFPKHQYYCFWNTNISNQTRLQALFNGGRDFILYPDDAEIIGRFEIYVLDIDQTEEVSVHCRIRAQGMKKKDKQLTILIRNRHL